MLLPVGNLRSTSKGDGSKKDKREERGEQMKIRKK
jgi:hypothetical protein